MTCEWPASALPAGEANDALLSQLLERLMTLCGSDNTALLRENVSVLKRFIEMWAKRLHPRRLVVAKLVGSNVKGGGSSGRTELQASKLQRKHRTTGMFLLDALLANGFDVADPADATTYLDIVKNERKAYLPATAAVIVDKLLLNVKDATGSAGKGYIEVQKPAARLLGAILRRWWAEAEASGNPDAHPTAQPRCDLEVKLTTHLSSLFSDRSQASLARGLELLGHLCESYPKLLHVDGGALGRLCTQKLAKVYGSARDHILSCLRGSAGLEPPRGAPRDPAALERAGCPPPFSVELPIATLKAILGQQQTKTQREALLLCSALADRRGAAAIFPLLPELHRAFVAHRDAACRAMYFQLLIALQAQLDEPPPPHAANGNGHGAANGAAHGDDDWVMVESEKEREEAAAIVRAGLLRGLSDKDDELREKMVAHWHARLPKKLGERLVACFEDLHAAEAEARWLHHSAVLLFCLSLDSKNYSERPLFSKQLKDGLRLTEHHVAPFDASGSYAMVPWGASQSQSQGGASQSQGGAVHGLLATQARLFSQTQTQGGPVVAGTYSSQAAPDLFGGAAPRARGGGCLLYTTDAADEL